MIFWRIALLAVASIDIGGKGRFLRGGLIFVCGDSSASLVEDAKDLDLFEEVERSDTNSKMIQGGAGVRRHLGRGAANHFRGMFDKSLKDIDAGVQSSNKWQHPHDEDVGNLAVEPIFVQDAFSELNRISKGVRGVSIGGDSNSVDAIKVAKQITKKGPNENMPNKDVPNKDVPNKDVPSKEVPNENECISGEFFADFEDGLFPSGPLTTSGDAEWTIDSSKGYSGNFSLKAPSFEGSLIRRESFVKLTTCDDFPGGGIISKVLSISSIPQDVMYVYRDDVIVGGFQYPHDEFSHFSVGILPGHHTVTFLYIYNPFNDSNLPPRPIYDGTNGTNWIDDIQVLLNP